MTADTLVALSAGARDLAFAGVVGALLIIAAVLPRGHRAVERAATLARASSVVLVVASLTYSMALYATIRGSGTDPSRFVQEWWQYSWSVDLLEAHLQVVIGAVIASVAVAFVRGPLLAAWSLVPVVWALAWLAQTGHAAGAVDHHLALSAMFLHLTGSAVWVGVIGVIAALRGPLGDDAKAAMRRVSRIAIWGATLVISSGLANAWIRLDSPSEFVTTGYGRILSAKISVMVLAVALAAWHRRSALPRLSDATVRSRFWRLLAVDVAALAIVVALAVWLSTTAPPIDLAPVEEPTPAYTLTGYALPPAPSFVNWLVLWRLEIISAFAVAAMGVVYVRWVRRLRRRGDAWPWHRTALWLLGVALMAWITQGGPAIYGAVTFSGHMVEHMLLVTVAPVFLTLGAPVTLALRALPGRPDGSRGPREWLRGLVESRWVAFFSNPIVAAVNFAGSLIAFYYSPAFEFALRNHAGHLWMLAHFTLAGYFFINALVGIDPGPNRPSHPMRVVLLFSTMAAHAFFGVTLTTSQVLLAPTYFGLMGRTWGPDAITDQQYGGQLAWGMGELPVVVLAIVVFMMWRQADDREARRIDRKAERDHDADLDAYNAMLAKIAAADEAKNGR